jgi:hypothetical protein
MGIPTSTRTKLLVNENNEAYIPIHTPSALLSRNPHQLTSHLSVSLDNLKCIRAGVADALLADETIGCSSVVEVIDWVAAKHEADRRQQLIVGSISALELTAHSLSVGNESVSSGCEALDLLMASQTNVNVRLGHVSTDSCRDNNIQRGVPFGFITEVSGPPSSGKTQFCLSVISNALMQQTNAVYLTSGNVLSVSRRLFSLCVERASRRDDAKQFAERQMDRISIASVSDAYELLALLAKLEWQEMIGNDSSSNNNERKTLLVIDSISSIVGHHLSSLTPGAALINQVGLTLRRMARTLDGRFANANSKEARRFGILIANGSVANWSETERNNSKPAMGRYWEVSDVELWMEEECHEESHRLDVCDFYQNGLNGLHRGQRKMVKATLLNHWTKKCGESVRFVVKSGGVYDVL